MKNIVIVGGSSGIGLALVQNLKNDRIVNISRTPCPVSGVVNIQADVTNLKSLRAAFGKLDAIDVLVYCAGMSLAAPIEFITEDDLKSIFDVNIIGAIECIKLAMPNLRKSEIGRIILLSSSGGIAPIPFDGFYSATKSGLIALASSVRLESDILSTAVIIGGTKTQFTFKRKIYTDCGIYDTKLKAASDALIKIEQTGYEADFTARKITKIINSSDPPVTIAIGAKNKLMCALYKVLPEKIKLYALKKLYNID